MRNVFSALVLASAFALLVPDNRGQAVGAADLVPLPTASVGHGMPAVLSAPGAPSEAPIPAEASWLLALGFLGAVVARRLRAD